MAKFLVTGGAGFIGGNFLHIMVNKYPNDEYVCLDALTYAGNMETLEPIMNKPNFKFVHENICNRKAIYELFEKEHLITLLTLLQKVMLIEALKIQRYF